MNKIIFAILNALARLPLGLLYLFSDFIAPLLYYLVRYRRKVVKTNLITSFPDKELKEIKKIEKKFYLHLGDQIVETLKLLHISDQELKRRINVRNFEAVNQALSKSKNAVLLMGHFANWEWAQEITRYFIPEAFMVSIYHPLSNKTWDDIFLKLRSRWNAHIVPMAKAPRVLLNKSNMPWVCGFIADAWTWHKNENNWVEFLNHKTWFIYGPEEIGDKVNAEYFYLEMKKVKRGYYDIIFHSLTIDKLSEEGKTESYPHIREFWKEFEKTIQEQPANWLWSHKRWK